MFGLAITLVLMVFFFFFVRQKLIHFENRLNLMSDTVQTMAGVTRDSLQEDYSGSDSDTDCSSDSETLSDDEPRGTTPKRLTVSDDDVKRVSLPPNEILDLEVKKIVSESEVPDLDNYRASETEVPDLDNSVNSLTLKELKDKVSEMNGPKLKTKKELIEFLLQNKI